MTDDLLPKDPWDGSDMDSAAGRQLRQALEDAIRTFGPAWQKCLAAIVASQVHDSAALRRLALEADRAADFWDDLIDEAQEDEGFDEEEGEDA